MYWVETQQSKQISCLAETIRNAYFKYWKENYLGDITKPFLFNWIKPASFDVGRWSTRQGTLVEEAIPFPHKHPPSLSLLKGKSLRSFHEEGPDDMGFNLFFYEPRVSLLLLVTLTQCGHWCDALNRSLGLKR